MNNNSNKREDFLEHNISMQKIFKNIVIVYIQKLINLNDISNENTANTIIDILSNLKSSMTLCNENIENLNFLLNNTVDNEFDILNAIMEKNLKIQNLLYSISKKVSLKTEFSSKSVQTQTSCSVSSKNMPSNDSFKGYEENTLVISEISGNVILPFKLSEINSEFEKKPQIYSSLDDVIKSKYIIPISEYKNPIISRFKEAYKLMREKQNSSLLDALDLGLELAFNSLLNPAIISACKNMDELDIYLDCLESNELEKFHIFNIKYEILPKK